jgi:Peptidase family M28
MKKIPFWCIAMLCTSVVYAQQDKTAMKYAQVISPELAKQHLSIIASDAFEGRETGTHGADTAAHYIANEFKTLGLQRPVKGSYFLDIPLVKNTLNASITVNGKAAVNGVDFYGYQPHSDTFIDVSQVAFVGYGTDSEIANVAMKGKIVVWINEDKPEPGKTANTGFRTTAAREQIIKNLQSKSPSLILAVNPGIAEFLKKNGARVTAGRMSVKKTDMGPLDMEAGIFWITTQLADQFVKASGKTYDDLKAASASGNAAQMIKTDVVVKYLMQPEDVKAVDVLGLLPGSDPKLKDEVLVISAHYDHLGVLPEGTKGDRVFNGADDDGSGTTGILEIATAFAKAKKEGHGPRRSILFLGNVGEEKGLLGSEYYTEHPVIPLQNTIVDLNIDMIGRVGADYVGKTDSANYVYVIGSSMLSTDLHKINENANNTYTKLDLDYKYDDPNDPNRFYYRSDHYNFAKHNVPIIFYFNGVHADYHGLGDEVSKINFPLLAKRAQLVFYTAWDLANADTKPVVDGKK